MMRNTRDFIPRMVIQEREFQYQRLQCSLQASAFVIVADYDAVAVGRVGDVAGGAHGVEDHGDFFAAGGEENVDGGDGGAEEAEFGTLAFAGGH